jgi:hypothetical protein
VIFYEQKATGRCIMEYKIAKTIKEEYESGKSQREIATKYNISQALVYKIMTDPKAEQSLKLSFIEKMFPNATLSLNGANYDVTIIENYKAIVDNIRKIVNDPNFTEEKKIAIIKAFLLD